MLYYGTETAASTNPKGMSVNSGLALNVWGQSKGTGTWTITAPGTNCAGIGGYGTDTHSKSTFIFYNESA